MKSIAIFLFLAGTTVMAANAPSFAIWTSADAKQMAQELNTRLHGGLASQPLGNMGNYTFAMTLRNQSGGVEVHEHMADIFVIESGEATLATGGKVIDPKTTTPGEIRGTSLEGATEHRVAAGDVLTIPAGMPHQMRVAPGTQVVYMAIKVAQ
jgi:mannose-6-phosphate isomerase-like protein (cupin superfamily)